MAFLSRKRRYPGEGERFIKYIYLRDDQYWHRSLRNSRSIESVGELLSQFYDGLKDLNEKYWKSIKSLSLIWCVAVLAMVGMIQEAGIFGLKITAQNFGLVFLPLASAFSIYNGAVAFKRHMISSLFHRHFEESDSSDRVKLLALYPEAFMFIKFFPNPETSPAHLVPKPRIFGLLFLILICILIVPFALIGSGYVFYYFARSVWTINSEQSLILKSIVIFSISGIIIPYLFPSFSIVKHRYTHMGLVNLLNISHAKNKDQYLRYLKMIQGHLEK